MIASLMPLMMVMTGIFIGPDAAPALEAVKACDRNAIHDLTRAEPHRRSEFAAAAYAEQQAIVRERYELGLRLAPPATPGEYGALDSRQRELEDARRIEQAWRTLINELRADFLANCTQGKRRAD